MKLERKNFKGKLILIPAVAAFLLALIPTLTHNWPLSWDIFYHVQYAKIYSQYGFTLVDPLLNAPTGQVIGYPPLFHLLLAALGTVLKVDYFQIARFMQPFIAMSIVLSVSYVAKKLYGEIAGMSTGFLLISSYMLTRLLLPIPENLALIFLPLSVYFYYISITKRTLKYAVISGILFILVCLSHQAAILCLLLVIISFTLLEIILSRRITVLKNFGAFLSVGIILGIMGLIMLLILKPGLLNTIMQKGIEAIGFGTKLYYNKTFSNLGYLSHLGAFVSLFALVGAIASMKLRSKKGLFMLTWILVLFLLSKAYWFGINVISYRVLVYILIPMTILGGFGLSHVYYHLKDYKRFSSPRFRSAFLIALLGLSMFFGVLTVTNSEMGVFYAKPASGNFQIAPPTASEVELASWFKANGNRSESILTTNQYSGMLVSSYAEMPMHYNFENFNSTTSKSVFQKESIGYIVLDKRLTIPSENGTFYLQKENSEFYPLYYYTVNISSHLSEIVPSFAELVYENQDFLVFKV
ncbi:hypothetical protein [Methanobacterium aggregans]|uniref:hypothetical protein n=1 Tax=Methanobacterium aggregans TaxID=1615586 RepID=UPI00320F964C